MAELLHTYDPGLVTVTFGPILITGYGPEDFVTVKRTEPTFEMTAGAGGDVVRVRKRRRDGTVTLTLLQASPTNDLLSAILAEDEELGTGIRPFMLKDLSGTTLVAAPAAWIQGYPEVGRGAAAGTVEWMIDCARLSKLVGGQIIVG